MHDMPTITTRDNTVNRGRLLKLLRTTTLFKDFTWIMQVDNLVKKPGTRVHMPSNLKRSGASRQKIVNLPLRFFLKKGYRRDLQEKRYL